MNKNDKFEDDFFEEDNKKDVVIKVVIAVAAMLIILIALIISLVVGKKNKETASVQADIVDYSLIEEPIVESVEETDSTVIDRNEPQTLPTMEPTPTPEVLPSPTPAGPVMEEKGKKDYSKIKFDTKRNLMEMESYFADGNDQAVWDLSHLDRYIAMSYSFRNTKDYGYYGDVDSDGLPNGTGIAVYADNQYYYGDWVHGKREGGGTWIHYHIHNVDNIKDEISFMEYIGSFVGDLPNGQGQVHYSYNTENLTPDEIYIANYICKFKDGYIDGDVYCTSTNYISQEAEWQGKAQKGSFEYISESRDDNKRGPVLMNIANPDWCYFLNARENRNIGVGPYISEYFN